MVHMPVPPIEQYWRNVFFSSFTGCTSLLDSFFWFHSVHQHLSHDRTLLSVQFICSHLCHDNYQYVFKCQFYSQVLLWLVFTVSNYTEWNHVPLFFVCSFQVPPEAMEWWVWHKTTTSYVHTTRTVPRPSVASDAHLPITYNVQSFNRFVNPTVRFNFGFSCQSRWCYALTWFLHSLYRRILPLPVATPSPWKRWITFAAGCFLACTVLKFCWNWRRWDPKFICATVDSMQWTQV